MKLYPDYKKLFSVIFLISILVVPISFSYAQTVADLQNQIDQKNADISSLEAEIATYQSQLDGLSKQKDSLNTSIKELDVTKKALNANIALTQKKIDKTNLTIANLSSSINDKQDAITNSLNSISIGIKQLSEFEQTSLLETILSKNDFTTAWNDVDDTMSIRDNLISEIKKLQEAKGELETTKDQTVAAKNQLTALKSQLSDQQKIVVQNTNDKNKLLKQTNDSEASYQALLKDRVAKMEAFQKDLNDYESQLQFVLDPSKLPSGRVLSWPLETILVTNPFGRNSSGLYASNFHDGVDFRATVGTPVMSMADGVVLGTGNTDLTCPGASYGKFVFIQYSNGLSSTFGHLSLIKVNIGDKVTRGEVVGYSGATGYVTGPHLHVSLYASQAVKMATIPSKACTGKVYTQPVSPINAYLNALDYLPPYTVSPSISRGGSIGE